MGKHRKRLSKKVLEECIAGSAGILTTITKKVNATRNKPLSTNQVRNFITHLGLDDVLADEKLARYDLAKVKIVNAMRNDETWAIKSLIAMQEKELDRENAKETIPNTEFNITISEQDRKL